MTEKKYENLASDVRRIIYDLELQIDTVDCAIEELSGDLADHENLHPDDLSLTRKEYSARTKELDARLKDKQEDRDELGELLVHTQESHKNLL